MKQLRCVYICFGTALRRLRSSKGFWISLLLIPVLMAVSLLLFSTPESSPVAGIAFDSDSPSKEALSFASLLEEDGFVLMEKADLREAVAGGEVDCGFLIPASFPEGGSSPAEESSIRLLVSQRTSLDAFFREKIAARLLSLSAPSLAAGIAEYYGFPGREDELRERFSDRYKNGELFSFTFESIEGKPAEESGNMLPGLLSGILSLFCFSAFLLSAGSLSPGKNRALVTAMGGNSYFGKLAFPLGILRLCFTFLIAEASLFLIDAFFPGAVPLYIWASLPWYLPALAGMEAFFAAVFPSSGVSLLPVLFAASLILCPIFLDITVFLPLLEPLRWILPPCWLYLPSETPGLPAWLWPLLSLLCLAAGYSALLLRCKFFRPWKAIR